MNPETREVQGQPSYAEVVDRRVRQTVERLPVHVVSERAGGPLATLVVIAFHKPRQLTALLDSLLRPGASFECLVVNVEADPDIREIAKGFGIQFLDLPNNLGYAGAVNAGALAVETAITIFANDDIICDSHAITDLANVIAQNKADVAVPRILDETGTPVRTIQAIPTAANFVLEWVLLPDNPVPILSSLLRVQKWRLPTCQEEIQAASGIIGATRTELLRSQPIPEAYFMYFEESEWFCGLADYKSPPRTILYCPEIEIVHHGGRGLVSEFKSRAQARSAVLFMKRHYGQARGTLLSGLVLLWQARLVLTAIVRALAGEPVDTVRARIAGFRSAVATVIAL